MKKCSQPLVVVIDTREQKPYQFSSIPADRRELRELDIPDLPGIVGTIAARTVIGSLKSGDYSIEGYEDQIAVERKSKHDLYSTVSQGRDRFEREISRLNSLHSSIYQPVTPFAAVVVEAELSEIVKDPPKHCKLRPKTILRTVIAWQQRYRNVHWVFAPGREAAEVIVYRILDRWWRDNVLKPDTVKDESDPDHDVSDE